MVSLINVIKLEGRCNLYMKKVAVLLMVTALSFSMLTGCGTSGDRSSDEVIGEETLEPSGMVHLESADEVSSFMDEVYEGVAEDLLPSAVETNELDINDADMLEYHTGLTDLTGIEGIYLSESMMSSTAYSAVYIRTNDDGDAEAIRQQLMDNINPAKWVCVSAEKEVSAIFGNDVFFVMGAADTVDAVYKKAEEAAGTRGMSVSEAVEKNNPM